MKLHSKCLSKSLDNYSFYLSSSVAFSFHLIGNDLHPTSLFLKFPNHIAQQYHQTILKKAHAQTPRKYMQAWNTWELEGTKKEKKTSNLFKFIKCNIWHWISLDGPREFLKLFSEKNRLYIYKKPKFGMILHCFVSFQNSQKSVLNISSSLNEPDIILQRLINVEMEHRQGLCQSLWKSWRITWRDCCSSEINALFSENQWSSRALPPWSQVTGTNVKQCNQEPKWFICTLHAWFNGAGTPCLTTWVFLIS